jgi:hypothetical protein
MDKIDPKQLDWYGFAPDTLMPSERTLTENSDEIKAIVQAAERIVKRANPGTLPWNVAVVSYDLIDNLESALKEYRKSNEFHT